MENILRELYQQKVNDPNTLAIMSIEKWDDNSALADNLDLTLLVIVKSAEAPIFIKHYEMDSKRAALTIITKDTIEGWTEEGNSEGLVNLLLNGKILFEREEYITSIANTLDICLFSERKLKISIEYGKLLRKHSEGKNFFEANQLHDAYNHIVHALQHLARLEVIDRGLYPETTVWNQVKRIDPQIYKLYTELIDSDESLTKRLELLLLASDFLIHSKAELGAGHLLSVMLEKENWLYTDLVNHPEVKLYALDLSILLDLLIEKEFVQVRKVETKDKEMYYHSYFLNKKC
ncbi:nucleotidyltransferase-like protein [Metabacillus fastidiosus]|uniref:nucleotidyltransferase-like protein n=1 Tax=Metabacillus fastidiosus TaxID=1458 RepID=UPI002E23D539|nr:nucleotidyltransferase-like protein [Metabacillus fastidiosus]